MPPKVLLLLLIGCGLSISASAQDIDDVPDTPVNVGTVLVQGKQPGPQLWKVTNGQNTLWILPTLSPLPVKMEWDSHRVDRLIAQSQEIIRQPGIQVGAKIGVFKGVKLAYQFKRSEGNPDGRMLKDVLPAVTYSQWLTQKQRFIGNDRGIETKRPVFAASKLYSAALKRSGLRDSDVVEDPVLRTAKKYKIKVTKPYFSLSIKDPDGLMAKFRNADLNDTSCMQATLELIQHRLPRVAANANAWATGNLQNVSLGAVSRQDAECADALTSSEVAKHLGLGDIKASMRKSWVDAASAALAKNRSTVGLLPLSSLTGDSAYLAGLRAKGYTVIAPY